MTSFNLKLHNTAKNIETVKLLITLHLAGIGK